MLNNILDKIVKFFNIKKRLKQRNQSPDINDIDYIEKLKNQYTRLQYERGILIGALYRLIAKQHLILLQNQMFIDIADRNYEGGTANDRARAKRLANRISSLTNKIAHVVESLNEKRVMSWQVNQHDAFIPLWLSN